MRRRAMKMKKILASLLAAAMTASMLSASFTSTAYALQDQTEIGNLKINYQTNPQGVESDNLRFSWNMQSNLVGQRQRSYRIRVYHQNTLGELVWDSGEVFSASSVGIPYAGDPLNPESTYCWTVTVRESSGKELTSEPSLFGTATDFEGAQWILPTSQSNGAPMFRTEKKLDGAVASAKLYITSLGVYNAYINGQEVKIQQQDGTVVDDIFNPGWTDYKYFTNYQSYDVTSYLSGSDEVALAAQVGKGWYAGPYTGGITGAEYNKCIGSAANTELALLARLVVTYEDGNVDTIVTNESDWKSSDEGPITSDHFFNGETYDARKEVDVKGWNDTGFNDESWGAVTAGSYIGTIQPNNGASVKVEEGMTRTPLDNEDTFKYSEIVTQEQGSDYAKGHAVRVDVDPDQAITLEPNETLILDMGQNMVGVPSMDVSGTEGTTVTLRHGELLGIGDATTTTKGCLWTGNLNGAAQKDTYILSGNGVEHYQPSFTYHGFRYIEVTATGTVTISNVKGIVLSSVGEEIGKIETSDQNVNQLLSNSKWSQAGNYMSLPTDCPQRGERAGWTGDAQLFAQSGIYNFDVFSFFENYIDIMNAHAKNNNDKYTSIMPSGYMVFLNAVSSGWSDAGIIIPWVVYQQTGDLSVISGDNYEQMDRYMDAVGSSAGYDSNLFGDWFGTQPCSTEYLNACYRIYMARIMEQISGAVGKEEQVDKYQDIYQQERTAFLEKYVTEDNQILSASADGKLGQNAGMSSFKQADNTQTAFLWALKLGLYQDEEQRDAFIEQLIQNIRNEDGSIRADAAEDTLGVGFLGVNVILPVLTDIGAEDVAYKLLLQDENPSWLYAVKNGATTIWERWDLFNKETGISQTGSLTSMNHFSYGACAEWMYEYMLGITKDTANPGFQNTILQPTIDSNSGIDWVDGSYESQYGEISASWTSEAGELTGYRAEIPANTTATLYLPVSAEAVNGFKNIDGVTFLGMEEHNGEMSAKFSVQAGSFSFAIDGGKLSVSVDDGYITASAADKTILRSVLTYAEAAYTSDEFDNVIASVQETFTAALENARAVDADLDASQETVDTAWQTLMTEIHKLGFIRGDKTSLGDLITLAETFYGQIEKYTPITAQPFVENLTQAKATYEDGDAMQDDVEGAETVLLEAMMNLRFKADKSVLESWLAKAAEIDTAAYTIESIVVFQAANENAKAVNRNEDATQAEVNDAIDTLNVAIDDLTAMTSNEKETVLEGDNTLMTVSGNVRTGDTAPIAIALSILVLAGTGFILKKKK